MALISILHQVLITISNWKIRGPNIPADMLLLCHGPIRWTLTCTCSLLGGFHFYYACDRVQFNLYMLFGDGFYQLVGGIKGLGKALIIRAVRVHCVGCPAADSIQHVHIY